MANQPWLLLSVCLSVNLYAAPLHKETSPARFLAADTSYKLRAQPEAAWEALKAYRASAQNSPQDKEAHWRVAMACHYLGMRVSTNSEEKISLFNEGRESAEKAIELDDKCAPCHFWKAINMSLLGREVGAFKMFVSLKIVLKHLERTNELDSGYAYGGAHRLIGLIKQKLPGILGGSNRIAKDHFRMAIDAAPDEPLNYLMLARLQMELEEREQALSTVRMGLLQPQPEPERVESREGYEDLKQLQRELASAEVTLSQRPPAIAP